MYRHQLINAIDEASVKKYKEPPRRHLGASKIGNLCERALFYDFRWMDIKTHSGRIYRLFARGTREEQHVIELLTSVGFKLLATQKTFSACNGHFGGSCDGIIESPTGEILLLEIKTNKGGSDFKPLWEKGVKDCIPSHYAQMCIYGYEFGLEEGLYVSVNKANDEIYTEKVKLDHDFAKALERKADDIINERELPRRLANATSTLHYCKYLCDHYECCFKDKPIMKNCRSCQNAYPVEDGKWMCIAANGIIPDDFIPQGCDGWKGII